MGKTFEQSPSADYIELSWLIYPDHFDSHSVHLLEVIGSDCDDLYVIIENLGAFVRYRNLRSPCFCVFKEGGLVESNETDSKHSLYLILMYGCFSREAKISDPFRRDYLRDLRPEANRNVLRLDERSLTRNTA